MTLSWRITHCSLFNMFDWNSIWYFDSPWIDRRSNLTTYWIWNFKNYEAEQTLHFVHLYWITRYLPTVLLIKTFKNSNRIVLTWTAQRCRALSYRRADFHRPNLHSHCRRRRASGAWCIYSCSDTWRWDVTWRCTWLVDSRLRLCYFRPGSRWHHCSGLPAVCIWSRDIGTLFRCYFWKKIKISWMN